MTTRASAFHALALAACCAAVALPGALAFAGPAAAQSAGGTRPLVDLTEGAGRLEFRWRDGLCDYRYLRDRSGARPVAHGDCGHVLRLIHLYGYQGVVDRVRRGEIRVEAPASTQERAEPARRVDPNARHPRDDRYDPDARYPSDERYDPSDRYPRDDRYDPSDRYPRRDAGIEPIDPYDGRDPGAPGDVPLGEVLPGEDGLSPLAPVHAPPPQSRPAGLRAQAPVTAAPSAAPAPSADPEAAPLRLFAPVAGPVVARFGDTLGGRRLEGLEYAAAAGDPVSAAAAGTVALVTRQVGVPGEVVLIRHGGGLITVYARVASVTAREGDRVRAGERIARVAAAEGAPARLHFELREGARAVDPETLLAP